MKFDIDLMVGSASTHDDDDRRADARSDRHGWALRARSLSLSHSFQVLSAAQPAHRRRPASRLFCAAAAAFAAVAADVVFYFVFKCGTRGCAIIARGQLSKGWTAALRCCEMSASGSALALTIVLCAVLQEG